MYELSFCDIELRKFHWNSFIYLVLTKLYELNGEEIDMNTFVGLLKESLRNNRLPVKESHIHGVASILFRKFS